MHSLQQIYKISVQLLSIVLTALLLIQQFPLSDISIHESTQRNVCHINGNGCSCSGAVCMCRMHKATGPTHQPAGLTISPCPDAQTDSVILTFSISRTFFVAEGLDINLPVSYLSFSHPLRYSFLITTDLFRPPQPG